MLRPYLPVLAVGLIGAAFSLFAYSFVLSWEKRVAEQNFVNTAKDYERALQAGIDRYLGQLRAVRAFFDASTGVNQQEFELFTGRILRVRERVLRLAWTPRVTRAERAAHEANARAEGLANYQIKVGKSDGTLVPAPEGPEYFPRRYSTSLEKTSPLYDLDFGADPLRRAAMHRARDGDKMATATGILLTTSRGENEPGFFVVLPVYGGDLARGTVEERRSSLKGFVSGLFDLRAMIDSVLANATVPENMLLYVFARNAGPESRPLYARQSRWSRPAPWATLAEVAAGPHWEGMLRAGDAQWSLIATPIAGGFGHFYRSWLVLAVSLLVTFGVAAYVWAAIRHTRRLERAHERVTQLAQTDLLTGLPNRRAFLETLNDAFAASRRGAPSFAVLYIDLDAFKDINDTLGHAVGDLLLGEVVVRIKDALGDKDVVARFGGDEFAVLKAAVTDPAAAGALADEIGRALSRPFVIAGNEVRITSSIGISVYAGEVASPEAMMMQADLALYDAKGDGRNCWRFHSPDLDRQVHERVTLAEELRQALENSELELYYQPQVELATGRLVGLEALMRWNHPKRGLLAPSIFIPIAEQTGIVIQLGQWVFHAACRQISHWRAQGLDVPCVAINVSSVQFKGASDLERDVAETLARCGVQAHYLELELTESVLMEATEKHSAILESLRRLGVRIAIDDFGTGYSPLKYLTTYPVNRLKLAQELVFRVTVDYRNAAVVRGAVQLAHELGIEIVAEGVETESQVEFLIGAGCEYGQGFFFSPPVNAERATEMLRQGHLTPALSLRRRLRSTAA